MKGDFHALGMMFMFVGIIILCTLIFVGISQYIANIAWRLGLTSYPAQWTIYAMGLLLCIGVTLSILGRIVEGKWWFK